MPTVTAGATSDRTAGIISTLGAIALVIFLVTPRASPGTLALLAAAVGVGSGWAGGAAALRRMAIPAGLLLVLAVWALASVAWAADKAEALNKAALLAALVAATTWAQAGLKDIPHDLLARLARACLATFFIAALYLLIEELSGHFIKWLLFTALPFIRPVGKLISDTDGQVAIAGYITNRNMAALALALWPMLLMMRTGLKRDRGMIATAIIVVCVLVTLGLSKHETSLIALAASAVVLAIGFVWPKLALSIVAAGWVVATLLVVPLASWGAHGAQLYSAQWLPNSARHRVVLWAYTAEQVQHRPLHGVGAASTKAIDARRGPKVEPLAGTQYEWRSGPHAHNVFLQTWYELGAIGAMLLCAAGLATIAVLSRLPLMAQPYAAAQLTTAGALAAFSWGMWQAWFLGAFAVAAVLMTLAVQLVRAPSAAD